MTDSTVTANKKRLLQARMLKISIKESDIRETFILGAGRGGQKINKTSSCVHLVHAPSNIQVKCRQTRSRAMNRFLARRELCDQIEERILGAQSKRRQAIEKIRRQKRRRGRRQRAAMLEDKRLHALKKQRRQAVYPNDD